MSSPNAGRSGRPWARTVANLRNQRRPCCLCGHPIDYDLPPEHPESFTVEHIKPWSKHPELRTDPGNLDAAHRRCNSTKGDGEQPLSLGSRSREW